MICLDGKTTAEKIREELKKKIQELISKGTTPGLAVILVGSDPASVMYVSSKEKTCSSLGLHSLRIDLPEQTSEEKLLKKINDLNADPGIHGILIQSPLPPHINEQKIIENIDPEKDVDGFHPVSIGRLQTGQETFIPCTPHGIIRLLKRYNISTEGKHVVIIGRSNIVGKPLAQLFLQKSSSGNSTVTVCHSHTPDIATMTRQADILVAAIGKPEFVTADMVKPQAVVIDVGINRVPDKSRLKGYRVTGDVAFEPVCGICSAITPVPGGVGPMTIAMLMENVIQAASRTVP